MNQLLNQVLNPPAQPDQYINPLNPGLNIINPVQFDQNPQQQPPNLRPAAGDQDQKNAESNSLF